MVCSSTLLLHCSQPGTPRAGSIILPFTIYKKDGLSDAKFQSFKVGRELVRAECGSVGRESQCVFFSLINLCLGRMHIHSLKANDGCLLVFPLLTMADNDKCLELHCRPQLRRLTLKRFSRDPDLKIR